MKQLILTGLATEQSFNAGGQAKYFLVFNDGEFRVPVTEQAAEVVVLEMFGGSPARETEQAQEETEYRAEPRGEEIDDGVDQI
jgi:hypothetical protein